MPSFFILDRSVLAGNPSLIAAPVSPPTTQSVCSSTRVICSRSIVRRSNAPESASGSLAAGLVASACSGLVFFASCVVAHSLAFWAGRVQELSRQMTMYTLTFSVYPQTIFSGWLKVLLFTAIPAGFIGYLPVELLRDFRWTWLLGLLGGTGVYVAIALGVFALGLKHYESGNRIGARV